MVWLFNMKLLRFFHLLLNLLRSMVIKKHQIITLVLIKIIKKTRKSKKSLMKILMVTHLIRSLMKNIRLLKKSYQMIVKQQKLKAIKILHSKSRIRIIILRIRRIKRTFLRRNKRRLQKSEIEKKLSIQMSQMNCQTKKSQMKEIKQKILLEMKLKKRRNLMLSMKSLLNKIPLIKKRIRVIPWLIPLI